MDQIAIRAVEQDVVRRTVPEVRKLAGKLLCPVEAIQGGAVSLGNGSERRHEKRGCVRSRFARAHSFRVEWPRRDTEQRPAEFKLVVRRLLINKKTPVAQHP